MATNSYADYIRHWGQIDDRARVNPELLPFEPLRAQLAVERAGLVEMTNLQAALKAQTQEITREIDGHVARGRVVATRLRDAIRAIYGRDDEKLTEFGLNVRRARKPAPTPPPVEIKKPSEPGPNPSQTAAPGNDASA
jgi:hypothetical protein